MPLLIVTANDTKLSQRFLVREQRFAIGRLRSSAVPIGDKSVSKTHVMISRTSTGYIFQDLFSRNGTFLNEERCDSGVLRSGDVLRLGRINITFLLDNELEEQAEVATPLAPREPDPLSDTQAVQLKPAADPPDPREGATPPTREVRGVNLSRAGTNLVLQRSTERRMRVLVAVGTGIIGLLLGILIARMDSSHPPKPRGAGAGEKRAAGEASGSATTGADAARGGDPIPDRASVEKDDEAHSPTEEARIREAAEALREGLRRPFTDPDESRRALYRLCLDLLDRTPTRAEERELLPLDPAGRWRRITETARSGADGGKAEQTAAPVEAFRRFLGRRPSPFEERALLAATAPEPAPGEEDRNPAGETIDAGLLLTASDEYRSADFKRPRSPRQKAGSLIVDLIDRPPSGNEEVLEIEQALEKFPAGKVARVLIASAEGGHAIPAAAKDASGAKEEARKEMREWVRGELQRFLLRTPPEPEIDRVMAEVAGSDHGPGRLRIALASLAEYRNY